MKRLLLVIALLAGLVTTAAAQDVQYNGSTYINRRTGNMVDANGNVLTSDGYSPPWGTSLFQNAINDTVTFGTTPFAAESTTVIPFSAAGYRWCNVTFGVKMAAGDTTVYRFALEARQHLTSASDSTVMSVIPDWSVKASGAGTDSTGLPGVNIFGSASAGIGLNAPWYGEHIVVVNPQRGFAGGGEAFQYFGTPRDLTFPLVNSLGTYIQALYVSFRVRILAPTSSSTKPRIVLHVSMGS